MYLYTIIYFISLIRPLHHFILNHIYGFHQIYPCMLPKSSILSSITHHLNTILVLINFSTFQAQVHLNPI